MEVESLPARSLRLEPRPEPPPAPAVTYAITLTCPALVAVGGSVACQAEAMSDPPGAPISLTWSTSMGSVTPTGSSAALLRAGAPGPLHVQVAIEGANMTAATTVQAIPAALAADAQQGGVPVVVYVNDQPRGYANAFPYPPYPHLSASALGNLLGDLILWIELPEGVRLSVRGVQINSTDYQIVGDRLWLKLTPALLQQFHLSLDRFDREGIWLYETN